MENVFNNFDTNLVISIIMARLVIYGVTLIRLCSVMIEVDNLDTYDISRVAMYCLYIVMKVGNF
jgi:hypothetical protein